MPIVRLLQNTAFDQKAIDAMTIAFEDALSDLELARSDPKAEAVARARRISATPSERVF
jgi:hypothetical protein